MYRVTIIPRRDYTAEDVHCRVEGTSNARARRHSNHMNLFCGWLCFMIPLKMKRWQHAVLVFSSAVLMTSCAVFQRRRSDAQAAIRSLQQINMKSVSLKNATASEFVGALNSAIKESGRDDIPRFILDPTATTVRFTLETESISALQFFQSLQT